MVRARLQQELEKNDAGAFVVTAVNVRNLLTDPAIEAAIRLARRNRPGDRKEAQGS